MRESPSERAARLERMRQFCAEEPGRWERIRLGCANGDHRGTNPECNECARRSTPQRAMTESEEFSRSF